MAIVVDPKTEGSLRQGDLLCEVNLHASKVSGEPLLVKCKYVLVVSADCAAHNKSTLLVVPVRPHRIQIPKDRTEYEEVRGFLEAKRDGVDSPDRFYLGTIRSDERQMAYLDEVASLRVPTENSARRDWITQHRVASLHDDFRSALRARLAWALSRPGFDDHSWYCQHDLAWIHSLARQEKAKREAAVAEAESTLARMKATSSGDPAKQQKKVNEAKSRLREFIEEHLEPIEVAVGEQGSLDT